MERKNRKKNHQRNHVAMIQLYHPNDDTTDRTSSPLFLLSFLVLPNVTGTYLLYLFYQYRDIRIILFVIILLINYSFYLCSFSANTPRQLNVFGHYSHPLCVDCAKICILKETNQICFRSFLKS
jgi:hypothetical protein